MSGGEGRADPIAEVLLARRPDVVGVHEATDHEVLRRLARRLSMDFVVAPTWAGRVALFTGHRILDAANVGAIYDLRMPILDATLEVDGVPMLVRVAHLLGRAEATRSAMLLRDRTPDVMLTSYDAPMGLRIVDGKIVGAEEPVPAGAVAPVRQIDQALVAPELRVVDSWIELDRLAYYASDHLPSGVEIEWPPADVADASPSIAEGASA